MNKQMPVKLRAFETKYKDEEECSSQHQPAIANIIPIADNLNFIFSFS
jgi:hypothetical protein